MHVRTDKDQRCGNCGEYREFAVKFERGPIVCGACLSSALGVLQMAREAKAREAGVKMRSAADCRMAGVRSVIRDLRDMQPKS